MHLDPGQPTSRPVVGTALARALIAKGEGDKAPEADPAAETPVEEAPAETEPVEAEPVEAEPVEPTE